VNPIKIAIKNYLSVFVVFFIVVLFGLTSYYSLPRETFPEIKVPYVFVNTFYLGVSPKDMEILVTNPIEKKLKTIKGIKQVSSTSMESFSQIFLEFNPDVDVDDALQRAKDKVDQAKSDLPEDAEDPVVMEFSLDDMPFIYVNIFGNYDLVRMKEIAEDLKDELEKIQGILEINLIGGQEREIQIVVSPKKLQEKGLSFNDISQVIQGENINIPGGSLEIGKSKYSIRIPGEFKDVDTLRNLIIKYKAKSPIYLKDIAEVNDSFKDQESFSRFNGKPCITLSVKKRTGANVLKTSEAVKTETRKFIKVNKIEGIDVYFLGDLSRYIRNMLKDLENNILTGFLFVLIVLMVFIGFRNAMIAAIAIPFSMLLTFIVLGFMGFTANFMVLYALVLSLGMLVDNAIVIVENIVRLQQQGMKRKKAAFKGASEVAIPVIASTLTTLVAFLPLVFWPGMMGQFMGYLPKTVLITLTASLLVALLINPVIIAYVGTFSFICITLFGLGSSGVIGFGLGKIVFTALTLFSIPGVIAKFLGFIIGFSAFIFIFYAVFLKLSAKAKGYLDKTEQIVANKTAKKPSRFINLYERVLRASVKHSVVTLVFVVFMFIFSIVMFGKIGQGVVNFPESTPTEAYVTIKLPPEGILEETNKVAARIEPLLPKYYNIKNFNTNIGGSTGGFSVGGGGQSNANQAQIILEFLDPSIDKVDRRRFDPRDALKQVRDEVSNIPGAEIEVEQQEGGPPVGSPVSIKIVGDNFIKLQEISEEVQSLIKPVKGLINLQDDLEDGIPEIVIRLNRKKMAVLGVNTAMVAGSIRTAVYGSKVSVYRDSITEEEYDITLRYPEENRQNIEDLGNIFITNFDGSRIPLKVFSELSFTKGISSILHKDFERVIEVSAGVDKDYNNEVVRKEVQSILDEKLELPQGYFLSYGGEAESQKETMAFLSKAFILAIFLIFLVLISMFHSLLIPNIIIFTVVLSMIGLLWGLILTRTPFSIVMTGVGIISLAGIVVNNGIILLEYIIRLRKEGMEKLEAIVAAGKIRIRPVLLTAGTTVLGLLPMSTGMSIDFYSLAQGKFPIAFNPEATEMWASMSNAVIGGLVVATLLTLVVVPALYYLLDNIKEWMIEQLFPAGKKNKVITENVRISKTKRKLSK